MNGSEVSTGPASGGGPGIRKLCTKFGGVMGSLEGYHSVEPWGERYAESNFNQMAIKCVDLYVEEWEKWIWNEGRFNQVRIGKERTDSGIDLNFMIFI